MFSKVWRFDAGRGVLNERGGGVFGMVEACARLEGLRGAVVFWFIVCVCFFFLLASSRRFRSSRARHVGCGVLRGVRVGGCGVALTAVGGRGVWGCVLERSCELRELERGVI